MRKASVLIAAAACLLLLGGCWDKHELEDNTFALLLGIDAAEDRGIVLTVAFPLTQTGGGGDGLGEDGSGGTYSVMSVNASSVAEGLDLFSAKLSGPLALYSVKTVVISREIAEGDLLRQVFSSWRYEQIRNTTNVLISACSAAEFIEARIQNAPIDPLRQEELLLEAANGSTKDAPIQLLTLLANLRENGGDGVALYGSVSPEEEDGGTENASPAEGAGRDGHLPGEIPLSAKNRSQICGLAVLRGGRMVGVLDSQEAQTHSMLTQGKSRTTLTLPDPLDPEGWIVAEILPAGTRSIRASLRNGTAVFQINLTLECNVESVQSKIDYTRPENLALLTEYIRGICEERMTGLIEKTQREYDADLFSLGDKLAWCFPTVTQWEAYDWPSRYRNAEINLNATLHIERTGTMRP